MQKLLEMGGHHKLRLDQNQTKLKEEVLAKIVLFLKVYRFPRLGPAACRPMIWHFHPGHNRVGRVEMLPKPRAHFLRRQYRRSLKGVGVKVVVGEFVFFELTFTVKFLKRACFENG